ncbi:uncharacterized protein [Anabrus simplex]|uniref:uncharacterized protein n=1 Tax=Anabrus simplex TaxID=316456 RepID=UPI0035A334AC
MWREDRKYTVLTFTDHSKYTVLRPMAAYDSTSSSSDSDDLLLACAVSVAISTICRKRQWVHETNLRREEKGEYHNLVRELNAHPERFQMYFRLNKEEFNYLHNLIKDEIVGQNTQFREAISTEQKLAVCLRYLATGSSFRSLGFSYRLGFSTVRKIVIEVCNAIWNKLAPIVMPEPTEEMWRKSAEKFKDLWNFPNCIAAIDGKHINIRCPINSGSAFYNYKGNHSVALLALVDAEYKFLAVDIGSYGQNSDGSIFSKSIIGQKLESSTANVPTSTPLCSSGEPQPFVIVGDEAFPLKTYLLRPYSRYHLGGDESKKVFNYRLSRARKVVENSFGILSSRWRLFLKPLEIQPKTVDKVVRAACCLHNMCLKNPLSHEPDQLSPETSALQQLQLIRRNPTQEALQIRENFKNYFNSPEGSVPWQLPIVHHERIN